MLGRRPVLAIGLSFVGSCGTDRSGPTSASAPARPGSAEAGAVTSTRPMIAGGALCAADSTVRGTNPRVAQVVVRCGGEQVPGDVETFLGAGPGDDLRVELRFVDAIDATLDVLWVTETNVQGGYLTTTFVRRKPPTDLTYTVQVSADLVTWATATTETAITSLDATTELVTIRDNVLSGGQTKRFSRVRVTQ